MIKSYFIDHVLTIRENESPVEAVNALFSLPPICIVSFIALPPQGDPDLAAMWVSMYIDPRRNRLELGLSGHLYLNLIRSHLGNSIKQNGLDLIADGTAFGTLKLSPLGNPIWICQIAVNKTRLGYAIRLPGKPLSPIPELSVNVMQSFIMELNALESETHQ